MTPDELEKFGKRWKAARAGRVRPADAFGEDCHAIDLATDAAADMAKVMLDVDYPRARVKRHRKRRSVLLVWCFPNEWEEIQASVVMATLGAAGGKK